MRNQNLNTMILQEAAKLGSYHLHHVEEKVRDRNERNQRGGSGSGAEAQKIVSDVSWRGRKILIVEVPKGWRTKGLVASVFC